MVVVTCHRFCNKRILRFHLKNYIKGHSVRYWEPDWLFRFTIIFQLNNGKIFGAAWKCNGSCHIWLMTTVWPWSAKQWTTLLLLNYFGGCDSSVGRAPPGMRPVADSILTSGTHSWKESGHEKISTTIISLPLVQERGQLSVTGEWMCTNDTGKLPRRLAWEQCG